MIYLVGVSRVQDGRPRQGELNRFWDLGSPATRGDVTSSVTWTDTPIYCSGKLLALSFPVSIEEMSLPSLNFV